MSHDDIRLINQAILEARRRALRGAPMPEYDKPAEEGGCGVVGFAASVPVSGRNIFEPSIQMHNRGNGKGGGIAVAGLPAGQMGVDEKTLAEDYIIQVALLDPTAQEEVEKSFIEPTLTVDHKQILAPKVDHREFGLEVKPPDVARYFVRAKEEALAGFAKELGLAEPNRAVEDEFIQRNSVRINNDFYTSLGEKRAFVLSHARNLMIMKIVGYAEAVVQYYGMEDFKANVWIAHQRYPTKGRLWHPGGSHPFIGMNEALVHNGDFANYYTVAEYLRQHGIATQFLTDTEVAVLLFDLWTRVFNYPLEYVIEAMAPTTELDFDQLSPQRQQVYGALQIQHVHCSPDGPWFFILARSLPDENMLQLLGITDTAMLRPQVFATQEGDVSIGLVGSEKQAIDATLESLNKEDPRFRLVADRYWNARGGSHTDGGAFMFNLRANGGDQLEFTCTDKFGKPITSPAGEFRVDMSAAPQPPRGFADALTGAPDAISAARAFELAAKGLASFSFSELRWVLDEIKAVAVKGDEGRAWALDLLSLLNDRRCDCGQKRPSMVAELVMMAINDVLDAVPPIAGSHGGSYKRIDWETRGDLRAPAQGEQTLVVFAKDFQPEGNDCDSHLAVEAHALGWRRFIVYGLKGQRFHGCGMGPGTDDVTIDIYGSSGDYVASAMDGMRITIHGNAQDQLGQILKSGRLVVHGDVGQAFMYGAKGGDVYVRGNAAGRPLINGVGRPRVVINGTCLDFLAESFMAGDPLNGGGFVVLNGLEISDKGEVRPLETPYPGSNLFSLASGGAIFVRDPHRKLVEEQLNGGAYSDLTEEEWQLILPYLEVSQELFGISIERDLLTVDGKLKAPAEVYRKVGTVKVAVLAKQTSPE